MKNVFMKICAFVFKKLAACNRNYDLTKEPQRFYTALVVGICPFILLDAVALFTDNRGFTVLGITWITLVISIRVWWKHGNLRTWLPAKKES